MALRKYRVWIVLYIIAVIVEVGMTIGSSFGITTSYNYFKIPLLDNNKTVFLILAVSSLIAPFIGVILGYLLGSLFLWMHKKIFGKKMMYYIQEKPKLENSKFKFSKVFFPALMAINLGMIFAESDFILQLILSEEAYIDINQYPSMKLIVMPFFIILTMIIAIAMFSPTYFLEDAGIVYTNKEKFRDTNETIEIRGVGSWYLNFLKGYSGLGTVFSLYLLIVNSFATLTGGAAINIVGYTVWLFQPFLVSFLLIPILFILNKTSERGMQNIHKTMKKLGITTPLSDIVPF